MHALLLVLLGFFAFGDAQLPTVCNHVPENPIRRDQIALIILQAFSSEPTGVPDANKPVPVFNGTVPSGVAIHNHGVSATFQTQPKEMEENETVLTPLCRPRAPSAPPYFDAWAMANPIHDGIVYLRGKQDCTAKGVPGWTYCQRVSCSYNSAIFVCNTNYATPVSPPCNIVADYAQLVVDNCFQDALQSVNDRYITQGEVFDDGYWHVYVGYSNC
ncbi:uncharacterized protein PG986_010524 [Apiospora aurea]|uniref:Uncharacterized protein n=1 Tax=Apiospora aurea TaxID=335848 RepID=A0ABR1Q2H7_9PEZI